MAEGTYRFSSEHSAALPRELRPDLRAGVKCPVCPESIEATHAAFAAYFRDSRVMCPHCKKPFDWWEASRDQVRRDIPWLGVLPAIGAAVRMGQQFVMAPGTTVQLELDDLGVPSTAQVLYAEVVLETKASDVVRPALCQGNELHQYPFPRTIFLYGIPPRHAQAYPTYASVWICYVDLADASAVFRLIVGAFDFSTHSSFPLWRGTRPIRPTRSSRICLPAACAAQVRIVAEVGRARSPQCSGRAST